MCKLREIDFFKITLLFLKRLQVRRYMSRDETAEHEANGSRHLVPDLVRGTATDDSLGYVLQADRVQQQRPDYRCVHGKFPLESVRKSFLPWRHISDVLRYAACLHSSMLFDDMLPRVA